VRKDWLCTRRVGKAGFQGLRLFKDQTERIVTYRGKTTSRNAVDFIRERRGNETDGREVKKQKGSGRKLEGKEADVKG